MLTPLVLALGCLWPFDDFPLRLWRWCWLLARAPTQSGSWSCSSAFTTSFMLGLYFGSVAKHWIVMLTALMAPPTEYWPLMRESKTWRTLLLLARYGLAHSTRLCSPEGLFLSTARFPDNISSITTPKLYTSLLAVKWPLYKEEWIKLMLDCLQQRMLHGKVTKWPKWLRCRLKS